MNLRHPEGTKVLGRCSQLNLTFNQGVTGSRPVRPTKAPIPQRPGAPQYLESFSYESTPCESTPRVVLNYQPHPLPNDLVKPYYIMGEVMI